METKALMQLTSGRLLFVAVLLGLTWLLLKWARTLFDGMAQRNPRMRFLARQVEPPLRILIWFGALLWSAQTLAPTPDAFLAALGSAIAIALAQDGQEPDRRAGDCRPAVPDRRPGEGGAAYGD